MSKNRRSKHVSVDIECDGNIIGRHSMISVGLRIVEPGLERGFYKEIKPITEEHVPEALAISGFTRTETLAFMEPDKAMKEIATWLAENIKGRPIFWADNPGFDFSWLHYYFLTFADTDPFGFSSRRIGDFICGVERDIRFNWKHLRKTVHDHNALSDATGNAEVLLHYFDRENIKFMD